MRALEKCGVFTVVHRETKLFCYYLYDFFGEGGGILERTTVSAATCILSFLYILTLLSSLWIVFISSPVKLDGPRLALLLLLSLLSSVSRYIPVHSFHLNSAQLKLQIGNLLLLVWFKSLWFPFLCSQIDSMEQKVYE